MNSSLQITTIVPIGPSGVGVGGMGLSNPGVGAIVLFVPAWTRGRRVNRSFIVMVCWGCGSVQDEFMNVVMDG